MLITSCSGGSQNPLLKEISLYPVFSIGKMPIYQRGTLSPKLFSAEAALTGPLSQEGKPKECPEGLHPKAQHYLQPPLLSADVKAVGSWQGKVSNDLLFPCLLARSLSRISFQHYQIELL